MATSLSGVLGGMLPTSLAGGKQRAAMCGFCGGRGSMAVECSSRPQKKATAHHMKTRPKKTQPWDIKRKGPTVYPKQLPLPPDWTLVSSGKSDGDDGVVASHRQQEEEEEEAIVLAIAAVDAP